MIDLASIRNASFTLTPTGYNPEEVDRFLADLADQLADGLAVVPAPEPLYEAPQTFEAAPAPIVELPVSGREAADVDGLREVIERTIGAMDAFVANELASLKSATESQSRSPALTACVRCQSPWRISPSFEPITSRFPRA